MSFSKQDARYEAKPLDLSEYSAVDMMVCSPEPLVLESLLY